TSSSEHDFHRGGAETRRHWADHAGGLLRAPRLRGEFPASQAMTAVTGHGLALPDDGVASGLRAAYARYLATCCQQVLELAPRLAEALRRVQAALALLIRGALERGQRQVITCFASPMVGTPLQCVALRDELTEFRERIDTATAAMLPALLFE